MSNILAEIGILFFGLGALLAGSGYLTSVILQTKRPKTFDDNGERDIPPPKGLKK